MAVNYCGRQLAQEKEREGERDMCCLQEMRWRGQGAGMLGMKGRRCMLWWSGKGDGVGGVGVMVKEELCRGAREIRRVSDRVMTVVF